MRKKLFNPEVWAAYLPVAFYSILTPLLAYLYGQGAPLGVKMIDEHGLLGFIPISGMVLIPVFSVCGVFSAVITLPVTIRALLLSPALLYGLSLIINFRGSPQSGAALLAAIYLIFGLFAMILQMFNSNDMGKIKATLHAQLKAWGQYQDYNTTLVKQLNKYRLKEGLEPLEFAPKPLIVESHDDSNTPTKQPITYTSKP